MDAGEDARLGLGAIGVDLDGDVLDRLAGLLQEVTTSQAAQPPVPISTSSIGLGPGLGASPWAVPRTT